MARDQRRHRRYDVVDVEGSLLHNLEARILNISLTGMAIETTAMLKVGGNYFLRLPAVDDDPIRLKADVKWCRLVRTEKRGDEILPLYQAGIDFRDFLDDTARQVLRFIESHIVVELERRIFGRFKVANGSEVVLDRSQEFVVRRLSLSGMLIETETDASPGEVFEMEVRTNGTPIETSGRVAYVHPVEGKRDAYHLGIEFVDVSGDARRSLEAIIESQLE